MRHSARGDDADTGVIRMPDDRPWESPGPPPWVEDASRRSDQRPSRVVVWIGLAILLTLGIAVAGVVAAFTSEDSGVAACRSISEGKAADGGQTKPDAKMTEQEYRDIREVFADSSDEGIRANGTTLIDLAWQLQQSPDMALLLTGDMTRAYTGLAGACAAHGYTIPALGAR